MDTDSLLYLTLIMAVWIIPSIRSSLGIAWAALFVLLQWLFVGVFDAPGNITTTALGISLISAHFFFSQLSEDPFSVARCAALSSALLPVIARVLHYLGMKPSSQILDFQNYSQVRAVSRLITAHNWAGAICYLRGLSFSERHLVIEGVTDDLVLREHVDLWLSSDSQSSMALLVSAQFNIKFAWLCRGSGVASTVTRKGQHDFFTYLDIARSECLHAIDLDDHYPEPYLGLITIAMGSGDDRDRLYHYFARAVTLSGGHYQVLMAMINAVLQKWGGEPGEAFALASRVLHRCRSNDPSASLIAVAHIEHWLYLDMSGQQAEARCYFAQPDVREELDQAYTVLQGSLLETMDHVQALNALAFCYYMGDCHQLACRILTQLNGRYVIYPWQYCTEPFTSLLDPAFAIDFVCERMQERRDDQVEHPVTFSA